MYWACALAFLAILRCSTADLTIRGSVKLEHDWSEAFKMIITIKMQYQVPNGWRMALIFSQPIKKLDVWRAKVIKDKISADKKTHALMNEYFNEKLTKEETLTMAVVAYKVNKGSKPGNVTVLFKGGQVIPTLPTLPPPTTSPSQIEIHPLKPIDESDSGFKMILQYNISDAVKYWSISLKFTKVISIRNFNIDKAKVAMQRGPISDSFCFGPQNYNRNLKANSVLRLEFTCRKAELYEAAPNAFFQFHPNSAKCEDFDLPRPSTPGAAAPPDSAIAEMIHRWGDNFKMKVNIQVINSVRGGWKITLAFSEPVAEISNMNAAKFAGNSEDKRTYYIENFPGQIQNANLKQCEKIQIEFAGKLVSSTVPNKPLTTKVLFERKEPEYAEVNPQRACPTVSVIGG